MEPTPVATLEMSEAKFMFQLFIVAVNAPTQFGESPSLRRVTAVGGFESQDLADSFSVAGYSNNSRRSGCLPLRE
jgi:hypothetical protein